jgi:hypothetical protein
MKGLSKARASIETMSSSPKIEIEFDLTFGETYQAVFRMLLYALRYLNLLVGFAVLTLLVCLAIYNYNSNTSWRDGQKLSEGGSILTSSVRFPQLFS